jgi:acylpyruvate hydrolase
LRRCNTSSEKLHPKPDRPAICPGYNGKVVQSASTDDLVFDVATLVSTISEAITLEPGDIIVTGTPSGVGHSRSPRLYMQPGDVCEVEIEGVGLLRNTIVSQSNEAITAAA